MIRLCICLLVYCTLLFLPIQAHVKMGILTSTNYFGEREVAWRIKRAGEALGWTVVLDERAGRELMQEEGLDWVICLLPKIANVIPNCPNYLAIFHPFNYLDNKRRLLPFYQKYDGYLMTIEDRETIKESLAENGKEFECIPFYPTLQSLPYKRVELNNLITSAPVWGNRLRDQKYRTLYYMLSSTGFVKFYGPDKRKDLTPMGYIGKLPFDGLSVIETLQKHGIVLLLHSEVHLCEGIPSSRIFEAAAASCVIISDENDFVHKHFGDSVYYIDMNCSAKEIFQQIEDCLIEIFYCPEKALDMAKKAHEVFIERFEMSEQLLQLEKMHRKIQSRMLREKPKTQVDNAIYSLFPLEESLP